ncbi:MAG: efflux transporter outer membrane subunit [Sphingomonadales bacterium]|nr:efflux transporter outer membrane subunit [Sphingomonadales bacterium]
MPARSFAGPVAAALLLSACSFAPAYHAPAVNVPAQYKEASGSGLPGWSAASPMDSEPRGAWWRAFGDPLLDDLEARAAAASPTLVAALARYDEARAQAGIAAATLVPEVDATASYQHSRISAHGPANILGAPITYSETSVGGTASYDLDLWGRIRNNLRASRADAEASHADLVSARLSLQAAVADAYVRLRGLDSRAELLRRTVEAYNRAYELTRTRHDGGISAGMDVSRARSTLSTAVAQTSDVANARAATEHELAALVGASAGDFAVAPRPDTLAVPEVPASQPSLLLQRRPDIAAAERRMFAANAEIGVAKAALFPDITLGLAGGWQTTRGALFAAPNSFWSLGPAAGLLAIFDGGRRRAQIRLSRAQYDEAAANYRGVVLTAFRQVEDGLAALRHLSAEEVEQRDAAASAQHTVDLALIRYRDGAADYLEVVTAQTDALTAQLTLINLQTARLESQIALVEALGGAGRDAAPRSSLSQGASTAARSP